MEKNTLNPGFLLTKNFDTIRRDEGSNSNSFSCPKIKSIFGFGKIRVSKGQRDKKILVQKKWKLSKAKGVRIPPTPDYEKYFSSGGVSCAEYL